MRPANLVALIIMLAGKRHTGPRAGVVACPAAGGAAARRRSPLPCNAIFFGADLSLASTTCSTGAGCRRIVWGGRHRRQGQGSHQVLRVRLPPCCFIRPPLALLARPCDSCVGWANPSLVSHVTPHLQ